jgi:hypothetical protein
MDQRIASFKFDAALCEIASAAQDESVRALRRALWFHYSDVEDHKFVASKQEWDYFNRLLLLLSSDVETELVAAGGRWDIYKTFSALCLAGFGVVALLAGFGRFFVLYWILSGLVPWVLLWVHNHNASKTWAAKIPIVPFPSVKSLLSVRRQVVDFVKKRYPESMSRKAKMHWYPDKMMWIVRIPLWVVCAPLYLLVMALPIRQTEMRLRIPADNVQPQVL